MENKLQNLKFRVYSEAHSKAIQEKLFELDESVKWTFVGRKISCLEAKYIFLDLDKELSHGGLEIKPEFETIDNYKLCTLDDLYKMQAEPNPQSELMTKLESLQKELDSVKEEISKLNK